MIISSLKKIRSFAGKRVLLRVDFNVAMEKGKIKEDFRIVAGMETINILLEKKASIVIVSHLGDPKGKIDKEYSLKPVAARLQSLLKHPVKFLPSANPIDALKTVSKMESGEIVFLENLRFNPGETANDAAFAKSLAALGDVYVNDAFSVSHRDQASVSAIKKYLPSYAGVLLEREVSSLYKALKPKKPLVVVMGGAKISTKAPLIAKLHEQSSKMLIGGALATTFYKFLGYEVGKSFCDSEMMPSLLKKIKNKAFMSKIVLPFDFVIQKRDGSIKVVRPDEVAKSDSILDIGPDTVGIFDSYLRSAATIVWNGPMGKFEDVHFRQGSLSVARSVASRSRGKAFGLIGGGETIEVLKMSRMEEYIDFISTAGGAMLAFLGGEKMPGLKSIVK